MFDTLNAAAQSKKKKNCQLVWHSDLGDPSESFTLLGPPFPHLYNSMFTWNPPGRKLYAVRSGVSAEQ